MTIHSHLTKHESAFFTAEGQNFIVQREFRAAKPVIIDTEGNPLNTAIMPMLEIGYRPKAMFGMASYAGTVLHKHPCDFMHHLYIGDIQFYDTWEKCHIHFGNLNMHAENKVLVKKFGPARFPTGCKNPVSDELLLIYQNKDMLGIQLPDQQTLMWGDETSTFSADTIRMCDGDTRARYGKNSSYCLAQPVWSFKTPLV